MNFEEIIKLWKELGITSCTMEFSCGGDSMNDYSFTYYGNDNKEIDEPSEITDYFESEVFKEVNFYECSDGHYLGEFGQVEIVLEEDDEEPRFSYDKQATSEWSERYTEELKLPLSENELSFVKEKVSNLNGGDWGEPNINYKIDCIVTDEEEVMINNLVQKICEESEEFEFEDATGEGEEGYQWTTSENEDDDEIKFVDNSIVIQVSRNFVTTTPSEE
jgi:hypothetical protein